jgi:hypothetical protein
MKMKRVGELMEKAGVPGADLGDLPTSTKRFPDGGWYRNEISGVERPQVLEALIDEMHKRDIPIHRVISVVMGATYLDRAELKELARLAHDARLEVILTPGPRSAWDTGRQLATPEGALSGLRFRGCDQLNQVITDIMRGIELGFRGFLVIDEGLLHLLHRMRAAGDIPKDVVFKVSIYAGHANPAGGKLLQDIGAGTFNPVADLSLAQFASIRKVVDIPMDLHILLTESFGGFTRFYDGPDMARTCAPCYFKIEPGPACAATPMALYKPWVSPDLLAGWAREKVKYAQIIHEIIQENYPEAKLSPQGPDDLAIPRLT